MYEYPPPSYQSVFSLLRGFSILNKKINNCTRLRDLQTMARGQIGLSYLYKIQKILT